MEQVTLNIYRGPRPKSLAELRDAGFKCVIDLQSGVYEKFHDDTYERERRTPIYYGINYIDYDLSDIFPPSKRIVDSITWRLAENHLLGIKTYVHCLHGKDRTGFIFAAFHMRNYGWSYHVAVKDMLDHGFHSLPYFWWIPFLRKYEI